MPNVSAHIGAALKVKERLNIKDDIFLFGSILPDIIDMNKMKSHYKERGTFYMIPNLEYYKSNYDLSNPLYLGYYFHLYLDYYYLEDYLEKNCKGIDVFNNKVYDDYDVLNNDLVKYYDIDPIYIEDVLTRYSDDKVNKSKLNNNIRCLKLSKEGELKLLDKDKFISFIDKVIGMFVKELDKG